MSKNRKSRKSSGWATRQNRDHFVKQARQQGLRARSAFKLAEIDKKYRLIGPGSVIVDLGAAPGSWCQYAAGITSKKGLVIGVDLLSMGEIEGVSFLQGDFTLEETRNALQSLIGEETLDLVLSDMAPNITGIRVTDQARAEELQESIFDFCASSLKPGGALLTKIFEGESSGSVRNMFGKRFGQTQVIKPDASRAESREIYILARDFSPS